MRANVFSKMRGKKALSDKEKNHKRAKNSETLKKNNFYLNLYKYNWVLFIFVVCSCCFLLYYLLESRSISEYRTYYHKYVKGMICEDDLFLSDNIDIVDKEATLRVKKAAYNAVPPVFSFIPEVTIKSLSDFDNFSDAVFSGSKGGLSDSEAVYFYDYIKDNKGFRALTLAYDVAKEVMKKGVFKVVELSDAEKSGYTEIVTVNNYLDEEHLENVLSLKEGVFSDFNLSESVNKILDSYGIEITLSERYIIQNLVKMFCKPNVQFDALQTEGRRKQAYEEADTVVVSLKSGMRILEKNTVISDENLQLLRLLTSKRSVGTYRMISVLLFNLSVAIILFFIMQFFTKKKDVHYEQYYYIFLFFIVMNSIGIYLSSLFAIENGGNFIPIFMPICFLPMHMTMITGRRTYGVVAALVVGMLALAVPGATYYDFFYVVTLGIGAGFIVRFFNRRLEQLTQWFLCTVFSIAVTTLYAFISHTFFDLDVVLRIAIIKTVICSATSIILFVLIPIEERLFNLPTKYRLSELYYGESALMEKLNKVAPGTYTHSRSVAEMAYTACSEIGANALVARVGGLYHDIGKMEHPEYFTENQESENKHDTINPSLSVSIIKNHVKVGAEMGKDARLPQEIIYIIANHHGTDVIQYFYNEAKKKADKDASVSMEDYSYNNSEIPNNRECGVVMLADSVEAAARSISEPTTQKFSKLIDSIVERKILMGQLDNCPISMKEISAVKDSFLRTLNSLHHSRIAYPTEEKK